MTVCLAIKAFPAMFAFRHKGNIVDHADEADHVDKAMMKPMIRNFFVPSRGAMGSARPELEV